MIYFKRHLRRLFQEQSGQGLVEFAIVLPILLLLTVGTILLTLSYIQKARMNGLAYMSARVAAVRRPNVDAPAFTLQKYKEVSRQNWVDQVKSSQQNQSDRVVVRLQKPGERLDALANLISGQPSQQPMDLIVQMQLPLETTRSGELRRRTYSEVDYTYQDRGLGSLIKAIPDALIDDTQMADPMSGSVDNKDQILSLNPPNSQLKDFYKDRGWSEALTKNSEPASGDFGSMVKVYDNFKLIESGGTITNILLDIFAAFAKPLGKFTEVFAQLILTASDTITTGVDTSVRSSFDGNIVE